jgi:predicted RNA-binding protein YlqC (UPF0109 family)
MDLKQYFEKILVGFVDEPDKVRVGVVESESTVIMDITVDDGDVGKIIGREGRMIQSLKTLFFACKAAHGDRRNYIFGFNQGQQGYRHPADRGDRDGRGQQDDRGGGQGERDYREQKPRRKAAHRR